MKKMHVTSNPFFAFHDDVFPAFSKNAVSQPRFPRQKRWDKSIIPDNYFSSLEELSHISTVMMKLDGTETFKLDFKFEEKRPFLNWTEILEIIFFDETSLLKLGYDKNGSLWIDSDYFDKRTFLRSNVSELAEVAFKIEMSKSSRSSFFKVFEEKFDFRKL